MRMKNFQSHPKSSFKEPSFRNNGLCGEDRLTKMPRMILLNQTIKKKPVESNGWNSSLWNRDNKDDGTSEENMAQSSGWSA